VKWTLILAAAIFFCACTKDVGHPVTSQPLSPQQHSCQNAAVISYSTSIFPLFRNNCNSCHATPGSGGIDLDSYSNIKQFIIDGQLMPVVTNTDASSIIMPPPPQRHLDSCDLKTLNLWIAQGCLNN